MKRILLAIFVIISSIVGVQTASAAEWVLLGEDGGKHAEYYVDVTSRRVNPHGYVELWVKIKENGNPGDRLILWGFHQDPKEMALVSHVKYAENGDVEFSDSIPWYGLKWDSVIPGSMGEVLYGIVFYQANEK